MIVVDYARLAEFQAGIRSTHQDIETTLTGLSAQIERLGTLWEGAAGEGFQRTVQSWQRSAGDLQDRLAELHNLVGRAHDNQARTVRSNSAIWRSRRSS